jgi:hypothetical protein
VKQIIPLLVLIALPVLAAPPEAPKPELKKTVDAFVGEWQLDVVVQPPGGAPAQKIKQQMSCKSVALARGASCTATSVTGDPWGGGFLIGYDVETGDVHFFAITSEPAVHDHVCRWQSDKALVCDPLKARMFGDPIVEDLAWEIAGRALKLKSAVTMKDGSRIVVDGTLTRK